MATLLLMARVLTVILLMAMLLLMIQVLMVVAQSLVMLLFMAIVKMVGICIGTMKIVLLQEV